MRLKVEIRKVRSKLPGLKSRPLKHSPKLKKLSRYLNDLNPEIKEMKTTILELLQNAKVQERIENGRIEDWLREAKNFFSRVMRSDEGKLLVIGCRMLGIELDSLIKTGISNAFSRTGSGKRSKELLYLFFEIFQTEKWDSLEIKFEVLHWVGVYYSSSRENAEKYLDSLFKILDNRIRVTPEETETKTVFDFRPYRLLKRIAIDYSKRASNLDLDSLNNIPEIVNTLALFEPELVFGNCLDIFGELTQDQFYSLCVVLSDSNSSLVQRIGEQLEITAWRNIA